MGWLPPPPPPPTPLCRIMLSPLSACTASRSRTHPSSADADDAGTSVRDQLLVSCDTPRFTRARAQGAECILDSGQRASCEWDDEGQQLVCEVHALRGRAVHSLHGRPGPVPAPAVSIACADRASAGPRSLQVPPLIEATANVRAVAADGSPLCAPSTCVTTVRRR